MQGVLLWDVAIQKDTLEMKSQEEKIVDEKMIEFDDFQDVVVVVFPPPVFLSEVYKFQLR